MLPTSVFLGFPGGSAGKESTCNARDLGWEDPLGKGKCGGSRADWSLPSSITCEGTAFAVDFT